MQGGGRGRGSLFGFDPFADFGGFGGLGTPQSLFSSVFGGRDPFDDPFFTRPIGNPFNGMLGSSFFGPSRNPFPGASPAGFLEHQQPQHNKRRGPIIEEIDSDDENTEDVGSSKTRDYPRKHSRLDKEPCVEIPDDETNGESDKQIQQRNEFSSMIQPQSQSQYITFQSSSVSYGANGAYHTESMIRREGSDGVAFEEFKEADNTTGEANHRITRGIHKKGHTQARKLNSDGKVDTMETLHNLNEDELAGFEQAWEGSAGRHMPGWRQRSERGIVGQSSSGQTNRGGWALPSTQQTGYPSSINPQIAERGDMQQAIGRAADHTHMHQAMSGQTNQGFWALPSTQQTGYPSSINPQTAGRGDMQQAMRRASDHTHMHQAVRTNPNRGNVQSRIRAEDRAHMPQTGRRAPDNESR